MQRDPLRVGVEAAAPRGCAVVGGAAVRVAFTRCCPLEPMELCGGVLGLSLCGKTSQPLLSPLQDSLSK